MYKIVRKYYGDLFNTDEWCSCCGEDQYIPSWRAGKCPNCGEPISPCSMCDDHPNCCLSGCPYAEHKVKVRRFKIERC